MAKAYFRRGEHYLRYDVDDGHPLPIAQNWPGFEEAGFGLRLDAAWLKITSPGGVG